MKKRLTFASLDEAFDHEVSTIRANSLLSGDGGHLSLQDYLRDYLDCKASKFSLGSTVHYDNLVDGRTIETGITLINGKAYVVIRAMSVDGGLDELSKPLPDDLQRILFTRTKT